MSPEFLLTLRVVLRAPGTGMIDTIKAGHTQERRAEMTAEMTAAFGARPGKTPRIGAAILHSTSRFFRAITAWVAALLWLAWIRRCFAAGFAGLELKLAFEKV